MFLQSKFQKYSILIVLACALLGLSWGSAYLPKRQLASVIPRITFSSPVESTAHSIKKSESEKVGIERNSNRQISPIRKQLIIEAVTPESNHSQ